MAFIERLEKRKRSVKHYVDSENPRKNAVRAAIGSLHYNTDEQSLKGDWLDIDTRWNTNIKGYAYVEYTPYICLVDLSKKPGFSYTSKHSGGAIVELTGPVLALDSKTESQPIIEGNKITWPDYYTDVDVVLIANNSRVTLQRVIKSDKAYLEYDVDIDAVEGRAKLKPIQPAIDSAGNFLKMAESVIDGGRRETLELKDLDGRDITPVYPIYDATVIDEEVQAGGDDGYWTPYAFSNSATYASWGWDSYRRGSFWFFDGVITIPSGATIDSGTQLEYYCYRVDGTDASVDNAVYAEDTATPSLPANQSDCQTAVGNGTTNYGRVQGPVGTGWKTCDLQAVIQELVTSYAPYSSGDIALYGVENQTATTAELNLNTYEQGNVSSLVIVYTEASASTWKPRIMMY